MNFYYLQNQFIYYTNYLMNQMKFLFLYSTQTRFTKNLLISYSFEDKLYLLNSI